jgi:hypothetical protein
MLNITDKADSTPGATGELTAAEFNDHKNELQGGVTRSGQTLSSIKTTQHAQGLFINGVAAASFQDNSATANSIELTPITGASGLTVAESYALLNGAIIEIDRAIVNTSTIVTVNIGQTTGTYLGAKSLRMSDDSVPPIGSVFGRLRLYWDNALDHWLIISGGNDKTLSSNVDFTILDTDVYKKFHFAHSASTGLLQGDLPTLADNIGKRYFFQNTGLGLSYINSEEGGNILFKEYSLDKLILVKKGDKATLLATASGWLVESYSMCIESGWYNREDWTSVKIGFANFDYDTKSGGMGDLTGEHYVLASGVSGLILNDSQPAAAAGILTVCFVTGTGLAVNNEVGTCGSGQTFAVNEGGGNNKNQDWNITHNMGVSFFGFLVENFMNTTASNTDMQLLPLVSGYYGSGNNAAGIIPFEVDSNNFYQQSGNVGSAYFYLADGQASLLDTDDYYINIYFEISI